MGRIHLFEFEDLKWCPRIVREATTDFLLSLYNILNIYEPAFKKIHELIDKTKINSIIDCCSGSGGPNTHLRKYLDEAGKKSTTITLTDKYPNIKLFENLASRYPNRIMACKDSLDATRMPSSLKGMRTFFSSFHHFTPDQAVKILQDAVNNGAPIAIFECTQRHPLDFIRVLLSPILMLLMTPFAKRLNWKKFFLTYILPITLVTNMWDYFVSNLRTYSPKELESLISRVNAPGYKWEVGRLWSKKAMSHVPYLIGYKKELAEKNI